jgi:hypothetical protein
MEVEASDLIAYRIGGFAMKLVPAAPTRDWIEQTTNSFAARCLPMLIANQAGWFVLNDRTLRAIWLGGTGADSIVIEQAGHLPHSALSHFGHGVLTFTMPFLFRTAPGVAMLVRGPANAPKDAIAPLEGLVETEWSVATAAMSWRFTRPNTWIEFTQDEPICMVVPQRISLLEDARPEVREIAQDPETRAQYEAWRRSRDQFNKSVLRRDPEAMKQGWQRHYFQGTAPRVDENPPIVAPTHRTRLKLREFSLPAPQARRTSCPQPKV